MRVFFSEIIQNLTYSIVDAVNSSNTKILGNGHTILSNFLISFFNEVPGTSFIYVLLFGSVAIFLLD